PGAMNANRAANTGVSRNFAALFTGIEFFPALFVGIVDRQETIPFFMHPFADDPETAFRRFLVSLHFFIVQVVAAKYHGERSIPALLVIYAQFIIRFVDNDRNS